MIKNNKIRIGTERPKLNQKQHRKEKKKQMPTVLFLLLLLRVSPSARTVEMQRNRFGINSVVTTTRKKNKMDAKIQ